MVAGGEGLPGERNQLACRQPAWPVANAPDRAEQGTAADKIVAYHQPGETRGQNPARVRVEGGSAAVPDRHEVVHRIGRGKAEGSAGRKGPSPDNMRGSIENIDLYIAGAEFIGMRLGSGVVLQIDDLGKIDRRMIDKYAVEYKCPLLFI